MNSQKLLFRRLLALLLLTALLLPACNSRPATGASSGSIRSWLDQPPDGATLPLAPFTLRAHASRDGGGVEGIGFLVNDVPLGEVATNTGDALVSADLEWNPTAAGEYTIQAYALSNAGEKVFSEIARVCVGRDASTDCSGPVGGVTVTPGDSGMKVGAQPDDLLVGANCPNKTPTINFEGYVADPEGVFEVYIQGMMYNDFEESREIILVLSPSGGGAYTASYVLNEADIDFFRGGTGKILYTLSLLNESKEFFRTSEEMAIGVDNCGGEASSTLIKVGGFPSPAYIGKCSKGEPMAIDFEAGTDIDPSADLGYTSFARIDLAYAWFDAAGTSVGTETRAAMTPRDGGYWYHLDVNTAPSVLRAGGGTIKYRAIAVDSAGSDFAFSQVSEIPILPCGAALIKTPTRTPTKYQVPQPGITPSVTQYVKPVEPPPVITTEVPPPPPPLVCSDYNKNPDGCKMAGCNFWSDGYTCSADSEPPPPPPPSVNCSDYKGQEKNCVANGCIYNEDTTCSEK